MPAAKLSATIPHVKNKLDVREIKIHNYDKTEISGATANVRSYVDGQVNSGGTSAKNYVDTQIIINNTALQSTIKTWVKNQVETSSKKFGGFSVATIRRL